MLEATIPELDSYTIEDKLGTDELTLAYKGRRKSDNIPVLIRQIAPQFTFDTYFLRRFQDAAQRNTELSHPNILQTLDVGESNGYHYLVYEWLQAPTLNVYLQQHGSLSTEATIRFVRQLASALDYAHTKAIIHGDLSDTCIFVMDDIIKVADFGLTHAMTGTSLVKKGFTPGNPDYLSPERVKGESPSRTADLYALGVLTYQMMAGQRPFDGDPTSVLHAQIYESPTPPHFINRRLRTGVGEAVLRMLSKGLELRHNTGAEFVRALQVAAEGSAPVRATSTAMVVSADQPIGRYRRWGQALFWVLLLTPILGAALALGALGTIRIVQQLQTAPTSAPPAVVEPFTPMPTFNVSAAEPPPATATPLPSPPANATSNPAALAEVVAAEVTPTALPTLDLAGATVAAESPFTNLLLAGGITADNQPEQVSNQFQSGDGPIYLFFDYDDIEAGQSWSFTWQWDNVILEQSQEVWPEDYGQAGTAWIFYAPEGGFNPGPYSVSLTVDGTEVANIRFIVQ